MGQRNGPNVLASIGGLDMELDTREAPRDWAAQLAALGIVFATLEPFGTKVLLTGCTIIPPRIPEWLKEVRK